MRIHPQSRPLASVLLAVAATGILPARALAGATEYAADGTRGLGRGGAIMTRPDDPYVMVRNPALLADLWSSMLYLSAGLPHANACFQASGGYGWGVEQASDSVFQLNEDEAPLYVLAEEGSSGGPVGGPYTPLAAYDGEPYPEVCDQRDVLLLPSVMWTTKVGGDWGFGLGFVPPEVAGGTQLGNPDGTVDTPNGLRPNPARFPRSHLNTTYVGFLGAVGHRPLSWLRLGAGLSWTLIIAETFSWSNGGRAADPTRDTMSKYFGQDAFVPGFTVSAHAVPVDPVDIAVGFRWEDKVRFNTSKVDTKASTWGYGEPFEYIDPDGQSTTAGATIPTDNPNVAGYVVVPPVRAPQLSFGIRFADRLVPRPEAYTGLQESSDVVRDPMMDERWDIEFNAVYYLTSVYDRWSLMLPPETRFQSAGVQADGRETLSEWLIGLCRDEDGDGEPDVDEDGECLHDLEQNPTVINGKDQWSLRLGGDYNAIRGVLALRTGVSYETRGQDPSYATPTWAQPFERFGIHFGLTWRIAGRTDFSLAYAHFFQETIELAINDQYGGGLPRRWRLTEEEEGMYHVIDEEDADGTAMVEIMNIDDYAPGPYYANAGTHKFGLDVFGVSIMQHF